MKDGFYVVEVNGERVVAEHIGSEWLKCGVDYDVWQYSQLPVEVRVLCYLRVGEKNDPIIICPLTTEFFSSEVSSSGWQDIATAPKDGSNILAWCDLWGGYHIVHWDESESAWVEGSWVFGAGPTDWKPIDPPPSKVPRG